MQKCSHCKREFNWIALYNSFLFNYKPITCTYCETSHNVRFFSRLIAVAISVVPFFLIYWLLLEFLHFNFGLSLLLALISSVSISFSYPFLAKYKSSTS
ncbi:MULTISPECIES: TIGR04104 family putative zinc finger protein [Bacillaceae]|uniref:TIGR04104 family putative zinc finger protein n=1 Tax=Bacillaceae TaxID=186817 RepID=UPI0037C886B1